MRKVAIIGAGWTGLTAARLLHDLGFGVEVFEAAKVIGGHSRAETLGGVVYEPNGAHIFHTSDERVAKFVGRFGLSRPYEHRVKIIVHVTQESDPRLLSWPIQLNELRSLSIWPKVSQELDELPRKPSGDDFETYVTSLMGKTLYEIFVKDYTIKQWGCEPSSLSSNFAPKRIDLRTSGDTRLFSDRWEWFHPTGINSVIDKVAEPLCIHVGHLIRLSDLVGFAGAFDTVIITSALDDFVDRVGALAWRGIEMRSTYHPTESLDGTRTVAYVINYPDKRYPYTRTVETKHATGQRVGGTIVSEEYPGSAARHYPIPTLSGKYESINLALKSEITAALPAPVLFAGRLANYEYINQDEAILEGMNIAEDAQRILSA